MSEDFDIKQRTENIYERYRSENNKKLFDKHSKEDGETLERLTATRSFFNASRGFTRRMCALKGHLNPSIPSRMEDLEDVIVFAPVVQLHLNFLRPSSA